MPRIAIDARKYSDFGIGTYIQGLLAGFSSAFSELRFHLLTRPDEPLANVLPTGWSNEAVPFRRYGLGEFFAFGGVLQRSGCSLFHAPHYTVPFAPGLPTVVTVHDLIHLRFPEVFSPLQRAYARLMIRHALDTASLVLTPSESTRSDLIERFGVDDGKVRVTPLGVGNEFRPLDRAKVEEFRASHGLPDQFVLFVGNPKPHKGISVLLQSSRIIFRQNKGLPLVIAGATEASRRRIREESDSLGVAGSVTILPVLPKESIPFLINAASVLAMPSLWEGFGLPAIEAMACGTPVVCTNAGSLPEVTGEAALRVPARDPEALAYALLQACDDESIRTGLRNKGLSRAAEFSWERTARLTKDVYDEVMG